MWKPADSSYPSDIDPGELIHPITFLDQVIGSDVSGSSVSWAPSSPPKWTWAKFEEPRGQTVIKSGTDVSQVDAVVTIRYDSSVMANMRFKQNSTGTIFLILATPKVKGENVRMTLQCLIVGNND